MYPVFNVQRPSPAGLISSNLGGAQSAFHVPSTNNPTGAPNSPPLTVVTIDPATVAQHAALLTLQAAAVAQAVAVSSPATSPFSLPSSPNGVASIGGVMLPLASPKMERLMSASIMHQQQVQQQQLSPSSVMSGIGTDRPIKPASVGSASSPLSTTTTEALSPGQCSICSDRATGKHYGANSCDGCKGFFRRTIRKRQTYVCRFNRSCVIDKDKRNTCRYCRFKKCVEAGMRREAVQNERDRISSKRTKRGASAMDEEDEDGGSSDMCAKASSSSISMDQSQQPAAPPASTMSATANSTLSVLLQAENVATQLRASVITSATTPTSTNQDPGQESKDYLTPSSATSAIDAGAACGQNNQQRLATISDLSEAIKQQLLLLVEWAKVLPPFFDLPLDDQVALLRAYSAQHLLLGVARRSLPYKDVLLLSNDACIPRTHSSELHDVNHVILRLLDELVEPMREIRLDDTEYACIKALLFFNPSAYGLHTKNEVKATRRRILEALQAYVNEKPSGDDRVRFGNILLLLPPLQAMSQQFIEDLQLATLFGMARFDKLLEELLLAAAEPLSAPFLVDGISAVANKVAGGFLGLVNGNGTSMESVDDGMKHSPPSP